MEEKECPYSNINDLPGKKRWFSIWLYMLNCQQIVGFLCFWWRFCLLHPYLGLGWWPPQDLCSFLENWLPKLGFNGLIAMLRALEIVREAEQEQDDEDCLVVWFWLVSIEANDDTLWQSHLEARDWNQKPEDVDAWGIQLDDFSEDLIEISEDWKHDLGAYIMARLKLHPVMQLDGKIGISSFPRCWVPNNPRMAQMFRFIWLFPIVSPCLRNRSEYLRYAVPWHVEVSWPEKARLQAVRA